MRTNNIRERQSAAARCDRYRYSVQLILRFRILVLAITTPRLALQIKDFKSQRRVELCKIS